MNVLLIGALLLFAQGEEADIRKLSHKDPRMRALGAQSLAISKSRAAIPHLIELVNDNAPNVRTSAVLALKSITGEDIGADFSQWKSWWDETGKETFHESFGPSKASLDAVKLELEGLDEKVGKAETLIWIISLVVLGVGILFLLVILFFVGHVSSKLKEWKEVLKQTEVFLTEGKEITKRTDRIIDELESKKLDIVAFIQKLKEENQAELDRYSDLLQQNTEHRMREEVMALRQKAEKELAHTLGERKGVIEHEIRRTVAQQREKVLGVIREEQNNFLSDVEAHSTYLEASFFRANGRPDEALRHYKKMTEMKPDHALAWIEMGRVLGELGRHDEAAEAFQKALDLRPDDAAALYHLAANCARLRKRPEMMELLSRAFQADAEYKDEALNDPAFKSYWDDSEFRDIAES